MHCRRVHRPELPRHKGLLIVLNRRASELSRCELPHRGFLRSGERCVSPAGEGPRVSGGRAVAPVGRGGARAAMVCLCVGVNKVDHYVTGGWRRRWQRQEEEEVECARRQPGSSDGVSSVCEGLCARLASCPFAILCGEPCSAGWRWPGSPGRQLRHRELTKAPPPSWRRP